MDGRFTIWYKQNESMAKSTIWAPVADHVHPGMTTVLQQDDAPSICLSVNLVNMEKNLWGIFLVPY